MKSAEEIDAIWQSTDGLGPKTQMFLFRFLGFPLNARLLKEEKKGKKIIVSLFHVTPF